MSVGLRVWDRRGQLLTDMTMTYPKFIDSITISEDTEQTIHYTAPQGREMIYTMVYLGRLDEFVRTTTATGESDSDHYSSNVWRPILTPVIDGKAKGAGLEMTITGFKIFARASNGQKRVPVKIYWGYV